MPQKNPLPDWPLNILLQILIPYAASQYLVFNWYFLRALEPALSEDESFDLLKVCVNSVISLPPDMHTPEKTKDEETLDPKQRKVKFKDRVLMLLHHLVSAEMHRI